MRLGLTLRVNDEASAAAHTWPMIATSIRNAYYTHHNTNTFSASHRPTIS